MNILLIILLVIAGLLALLLISAFFMKKEYYIQREIIINASLDKVYGYLKHLRNQDNFNKWVMADPSMKKEFKGTDGTVGFIYAWNGTKGGEGEQEIKQLIEGKSIETEIRFVRPFPAVAYANMLTEPVASDKTKVIWTNKSSMKYPMNVMRSMIEKMLAKDMDTSLGTLKKILEN
jgi:hypothetical protein